MSPGARRSSEGSGELGPLLFQAASSLETALALRGPVPMIADDGLIPFDDRRTAAALRAPAGLRGAQSVVVFTHHGHACKLAQTFCNMIGSSSIGSRVERVASQWAEMS